MSGIVGMVNLDGRPVSQELLRRMTDAMAFRGPDAQEIWIDGNVGFGHTMLRTTFEAESEHQPFSLDGRVWITADARVDDRKHLISKIESRLDHKIDQPTDVELILRAYLVWGDNCLNHLIGDFSFAIWDGLNQRLFCARDHFGVKPFYYARLENCLIVSNTLDCIRLHRDVAGELNEQAIGDFLLVGSNQDEGSTFFRDISRLPAGHSLSSDGGSFVLCRYWTLEVRPEIRFNDERECVEEFVDHLEAAVADRMRADRIGIFLSGGMDSATVASSVCTRRASSGQPLDLRALTVVYEHLFLDREGYYANQVAEFLDISLEYLKADDYRLYDRFFEPEMCTSEPIHDPLAAIKADRFARMARVSRVVLTGEGGDAILRPSFSAITSSLNGASILYHARHLINLAYQTGRLPRIGFRTRLKKWLDHPILGAGLPSWLDRDFAERLSLRNRCRELVKEAPSAHPRRPEAYKYLNPHGWSSLFEGYDPGVTRQTLEVRHPLLDRRMVDFCLSLPSLPWCIDKRLMRLAMKADLPAAVLERNKSPVAADPLQVRLRDGIPDLINEFQPHTKLGRFVVVGYHPKMAYSSRDFWRDLLPVGLNYWLHMENGRHASTL